MTTSTSSKVHVPEFMSMTDSLVSSNSKVHSDREDAIRLLRVGVKPGRISLLVEIKDPHRRYTDPALMKTIEQDFPDLRFHRCKNSLGPTFGDVMDQTPVPHLLEHLIISHQAANPDQPIGFNLVGSSQWLNRETGRARIEVNFSDDLIALGACTQALAYLNERL